MTRVAVIGAHGKVGQQILHLLYDAGHEAVGVVRNPEHSEDIVRLGGEPLVHDLEHSTAEDFAGRLEGVDALVFTAGAGPDSGPERKRTVRSQSRARPGSWVTRTRVAPRSRLRAKRRSTICRPVASSRLPVGSSATRIAGSGAMARAMATRCCSPPES